MTNKQVLARFLHDVAQMQADEAERIALRRARFIEVHAIPLENKHPQGPRPVCFHPVTATCTHRVSYYDVCQKCNRKIEDCKAHAKMLFQN